MAKPRVSKQRIAAINGARLNTAADVRILRGAAKAPHVWAYVHPTVDDVLVPLMAQADVIGIDLLAEMEDYLGKLRSPESGPPVMPVLEFARLTLDIRRAEHDHAQSGAAAVEATRRASMQHARDRRRAVADDRAKGWIDEIEQEKKKGRLKKITEGDIAEREQMQLASVQKVLAQYRKRQRKKKSL